MHELRVGERVLVAARRGVAVSPKWRPITDYETDPAELSDKELRALAVVWVEQRAKLGESALVSEFTERLKREWAIETGLIERLYTLDRGITELMIEHGVNADLIPHATEENPIRVAAMINDQQAAIDSVFAFVKGDRPLSTSYVKELHSLFTRHQDFVEGRDQFGRTNQVPLIHGDYKKQPNNPTRPDGSVHLYCPPEQVASEMDRLIEFHMAHDGIAPEVEAAWLHHRFAQIHPFQDGNGRIARATEEAARVDTRIESIKRRLAQPRDTSAQEWEAAVSTAAALQALASERLGEVVASLQEATKDDVEFTFFADGEDNEGPRSHYFHRQVVSTARKLGYYANMRDYRSWARLAARAKDGNQGTILIAFHCIGYEFLGVLACSGTWFLRAKTDDNDYETGGEAVLSDEVFQINYKEDVEDVKVRFRDWLERVIERGLALWEAAL